MPKKSPSQWPEYLFLLLLMAGLYGGYQLWTGTAEPGNGEAAAADQVPPSPEATPTPVETPEPTPTPTAPIRVAVQQAQTPAPSIKPASPQPVASKAPSPQPVAATPAPAAPSPPPASAAPVGQYTLQTGAFDTPGSVERAVQTLRAQGHDAWQVKNPRFYCAMVGRYATRQDAEIASARLRQAGVDNFIVTQR